MTSIALLPVLLATMTAPGAAAASAPPASAPAPAVDTTSTSAPTASPSPVRVVAKASRSRVTIGEIFTVELAASGPPGTSYVFPGELTDETFELRPRHRAEGSGRGAPPPGVQPYDAAVFALGEAQLPPLLVRYRLPDGTTGEVSSEPVLLEVASLLPKEAQQQKLTDIRPPVPVSIGAAFWVALAAALFAAASLVLLLRRRRRAIVQPARVEPAVAPDVDALRALEELARSSLLARQEHRSFYIRLTEIAKRYLERRLNAPVLEMTSAETLAFLRGHPVGDALVPLARDLAEAADRIKFANGEGLTAEAERHLEAVRALVLQVEERLRPLEPPAEGRAA